MTHSVDIFIQAHQARQNGIHMTPRSVNDKEYFPQDWFIDRLNGLGTPYQQQGRNKSVRLETAACLAWARRAAGFTPACYLDVVLPNSYHMENPP